MLYFLLSINNHILFINSLLNILSLKIIYNNNKYQFDFIYLKNLLEKKLFNAFKTTLYTGRRCKVAIVESDKS